jgi:hypothetical protein
MPYADAAKAPDAIGAMTEAEPYVVRTNAVARPKNEAVSCSEGKRAERETGVREREGAARASTS